jgi:hypothetical protein
MAKGKRRKLSDAKLAKVKRVRAKGGKQREAAKASGVKVSQATVSLAEKLEKDGAPSLKKALAATSTLTASWTGT